MASQTCPHCGSPIRAGAKFCAKCGKTTVVAAPAQAAPVATTYCENCGNPNRVGAKFCAKCRAPLMGVAASAVKAPFWKQRKVIIAGIVAIVLLCVITASAIGAGMYFNQPKGTPTITGTISATATILTSITPSVTLPTSTTVTTASPTQRSPTPGTPPPSTGTPSAASTVIPGTPRLSTTTVPPAAGTAPSLTPIVINVPGVGVNVTIPHITDQEEIDIGRETAKEFEREFRVSTDARVTQIGQRLVPMQSRQIPFTFKVAETNQVNAFALPGGFIYVTRGMLRQVRSDDELAGVIGHEIAHVALRHGAQQIEVLAAAEAAIDAVTRQNPDFSQIYKDKNAQLSIKLAAQVSRNQWGQRAELDADEYGTIYMARAGYNPQAVIDLFRRFAANETSGDPLDRLLATHPPFSERIGRVEQAIRVHGLR